MPQEPRESLTAATAGSLDSPRHAQLDNVPREPAAQAPEAEDGIRKQETRLAAEYVAQLAVQRLERRQRQEVRRGDPAGAVQRPQLAAYLAVGGDRERLVERHEEDLQFENFVHISLCLSLSLSLSLSVSITEHE